MTDVDQSMFDMAIERWADAYADKVYVRALFIFMTGLLPGVNAFTDTARELISEGVERIRRERQRAFFDELAKGETYLTEEIINSEDFLHNFMATYTAAMHTKHRKKVKQFARLLLTGVRHEKLESDEFEEFLGILDDLSPREYEILLILKRYEDDNPNRSEELEDGTSEKVENDAQHAHRFWGTFVENVESSTGIDKLTLASMLVRLTRTGLYETFAGILLDYIGGKGHTTPMFKTFVAWLEEDTILES